MRKLFSLFFCFIKKRRYLRIAQLHARTTCSAGLINFSLLGRVLCCGGRGETGGCGVVFALRVSTTLHAGQVSAVQVQYLAVDLPSLVSGWG